MKKIIIVLIFIMIGLSKIYAFDPMNNYDICRNGGTFSCTENYVYWDDFQSKIMVEKYDWNEYNSREVGGRDFHGPKYINIVNIKYTNKEKYDGKYLTISRFYESKYGNHAIYSVSPYVNNTENNFTEKEIEEGKQELFEKYKDIVGLYIDDKRVGEYNIDGKYDYKNLDSFLLKNKIMAFDYDDNYIFPKTDYILKEKTIKTLNNFVEKVEKIKYDKEKLLKKIDKIYNKYKTKEGRKNKFITEVLLYLHTEILINKLKQNNNLLKINYKN